MPYGAAFAVAIPLVVLVLHELWTMRVPGFMGGDFAVSNIATRSALHLNRLLGPYSRFEWNHPGPTIYYLSVPLFAASGQRFGGLTASAALLNLVLGVGIVVVVGRLGSRRDGIAAGAVMLVFVSFGGFDRLRSAWNPDMVILPVAAVLILAAALVSGRRWALPVLAVVGSIAVQTHLGTAPVVVLIVVVAVGCTAWLERYNAETWRHPAAWALIALVIVWALPFYEQITRNPGNFTLLWRFFTGDAPHAQVSIAEALRLVVGQATLTWVPGTSFVASTTVIPLPWWRWAVLVALVALAVGGCRVAWRRGDRFLAALRGFPLVALVVAGYSVVRTPGVMASYLTTYSLSVGVCLWIAAASTIAELLSHGVQLLATNSRAAPLNVARLRIAFSSFAVCALVVGGVAVAWRWRTMPPMSVSANVPAVSEVYDRVSARVPQGQPLLITMRGTTGWEVGAGVIDALERDGHTVRVGSDWLFMFGHDHRPRQAPPTRFLVTSPGATRVVLGMIPIPLPATTGVRLYELSPNAAFPGI